MKDRHRSAEFHLRARTAWRVAHLSVIQIGILLAIWSGMSVKAGAQASHEEDSSAGRVPVVSGGAGYVFNSTAGVPTLEPQVDPVLLVPFGSHLLLESRTDFTGFFQRRNQTSGPYGGKVFKTVEYAQLDWLASSRVIVSGGKYLLPFGLYNERLEPIWIRNLQDTPLTLPIGTRTSGAGDGVMLRGVAAQARQFSIQYSAYFSARSGINQLEAARTAGGDVSAYFYRAGIEIGTSWQRFLQNRQINNSAVYLSWQPPSSGVDVKAEYDYSYFGYGYWAEGAYRLDRLNLPAGLGRLQPVVRMQELWPLHGGGNGLPRIQTRRFDFGLNYYLRDNLRLVSSYGRSFSTAQNANAWNLGVTWRFTMPLWPGRSR
jgi:hypothetical protein